MGRFFEVSRSGYYDYVKRMETPDRGLPLAEKIRKCQEVVIHMAIAEYIYGLKDKIFTMIQKRFFV